MAEVHVCHAGTCLNRGAEGVLTEIEELASAVGGQCTVQPGYHLCTQTPCSQGPNAKVVRLNATVYEKPKMHTPIRSPEASADVVAAATGLRPNLEDDQIKQKLAGRRAARERAERRKRGVFDLRELQSTPIRSIACDIDGRIDPKLLLPKPWAGYKLDATRPLTELGKTEILHSRAPRCPEYQADGRARELLRAFREKALYLCDGRRAVSWRCHECWLRRDRDQVNNMEAHACPYESCGAPRDKVDPRRLKYLEIFWVENEFLPETPKAPRPRAYIDLSIDDKPTGRIVFELFDDKAPKTVERFLKHCKSLRGLREVRNPFPDTYPWDSIGEDPVGRQGGDFDGGDDDDYTWRGWSFGYDTSHTDFSTRFQEEEEDEAKFTIYEPFIREGTLYFRYPQNPRCLNRPTGFYILQGTRPSNAGAFGRDVPFGRVLNYDASGFEAEPDPPKGMKNSGDTMSEIEHHWADLYDLMYRLGRRGAAPSDRCFTEAEAAQLLHFSPCRDVTEALRRYGADWTNWCEPNVKIIACGRLEDADDSISRRAYLAALPPHVLRALGPIDNPVYKFLEPYGDDWERAVAAVAGFSEQCAIRVAELSPDDYSGLFHALAGEYCEFLPPWPY
mmetsp:Transcript_6964/g.17839  ORF Transcript_6964/g.17839 Transcript_6964/m.17839 type:complete len:619 (+) Transcript_6964:287-2143(+)